MAKEINKIEKFNELASEDFSYGIRLVSVSGTLTDSEEKGLSEAYPQLIINRTGESELNFHLSNGKTIKL